MKQKMDPFRILINALSARTGGVETFLVNLLPLLAQFSPALKMTLLIPSNRLSLYSNLSDVIDIQVVPDSVFGSRVKRLLFEHGQVPILHRGHTFDLHFQVDEMLSPAIL